MMDKIKKLIASTCIEDIQMGMILFSKTPEYERLVKSRARGEVLYYYPINCKMRDVSCGVAFKDACLWISYEHLIFEINRGRVAEIAKNNEEKYNFLIYEED